jgi:hypothetical protein
MTDMESREAAWWDGLCDGCAAKKCGVKKQAYYMWRHKHEDMLSNHEICPICNKKKKERKNKKWKKTVNAEHVIRVIAGGEFIG